MTRRSRRGIALAALALIALSCRNKNQIDAPPAPHAAPAKEGFEFAAADRKLVFPNDFGAHPAFQTEWWYYTGNVRNESGRHFGYQLTFFRRSLRSASDGETRAASLASQAVYMGHFALTDTQGAKHYSFERYSRAADAVAGARAQPHAVWLDDWQVSTARDGVRHIRAADGGIEIDLRLRPTKGPLAHGNRGYSQKGSDPNRASHYYSFPRMRSQGSITILGNQWEVQGESWMDHEFTSSGLADNQIGWDWFSLQLDNGFDLMLFHLRTDTGDVDPYSSGTIMDPAGLSRTLRRDDFSIEPTAHWRSPHTHGDYPSRWTIAVPSADLEIEVTPVIADQELVHSFVYWEGSVRISGNARGKPVAGFGFAELTGYARSMAGSF